MRKAKAQQAKQVAMARVQRLLDLASTQSPQGGKPNVAMARKISLKYRLRLPPELRHTFCKKCLTYWFPAKTVQIRIAAGKLTRTCLSCGTITRTPFKKTR